MTLRWYVHQLSLTFPSNSAPAPLLWEWVILTTRSWPLRLWRHSEQAKLLCLHRYLYNACRQTAAEQKYASDQWQTLTDPFSLETFQIRREQNHRREIFPSSSTHDTDTPNSPANAAVCWRSHGRSLTQLTFALQDTPPASMPSVDWILHSTHSFVNKQTKQTTTTKKKSKRAPTETRPMIWTLILKKWWHRTHEEIKNSLLTQYTPPGRLANTSHSYTSKVQFPHLRILAAPSSPFQHSFFHICHM